MFQADLPIAIREGRFPLYKTPIHDITDECLDRIVPDPPGVEYLVPILAEALDSVYIKQMKRMLLPRPSNNATLCRMSRDSKRKKRSTVVDERSNSRDSDDREGYKYEGRIAGLEFLLNAKTKKRVTPDEGTCNTLNELLTVCDLRSQTF
jgi:hypothetical protein